MADPAIKLPEGFQDAAPVVAAGPKLPPGFEDATPVKTLGRDVFGDIPDNLYTRIGARIKANFNLPEQVRNAGNAISEAIADVKQNGLFNGKHRLPEVIQSLKDTYSVPANVIGDVLSAAILHAAGPLEIPGKAPATVPESAPLDLTSENKPYAGEKTPPVTPYPAGAEPPAPRIPDKYKPPIPGVNVPPNVARISEPVIPSEPPAPANPDYVPFRPSIERILDEIKEVPGYKNIPRAELDAKFTKALQEVQQENAKAPEPAPTQDLTSTLEAHLKQLRARGKSMARTAPKETLDEFNARLGKIADAQKAARSLEDLR